jgi:ATP-binding cassette subfamily F protein uup
LNYLQVDNLTKSFGVLVLFENLCFTVDKDQRVALIARNGAGKTSLLKIIGGKDSADSGNLIFRNDITVGYLEQEPPLNPELSVMDEVYLSSNDVLLAIKEYELACEAQNSDKLDDAIHKMDLLKAWDYEIKVKQILSTLKITDLDKKVGLLSGGQKKRLALASVLISEPDILILDEPTNHLDLDMIEWLEGYLKNAKSTLIMVTHDRYFLDRVCDVIYELDDNQIFRYKGNYSYFLEKREDRVNNQNTEIDKARALYKKELDWINRSPSARSTKAKYRIDSFYETKEVAQQKRNQDEVQIDVQSSRLGKKVIELYNLNKSFGTIKILEDFSYNFKKGEKVGIVGDNGCGKSTFLNLLTGTEKLTKGTIEIGSTVVIGYYTQDGIMFDENQRLIDVIKDVAEDIPMGDGRKLSPTQFLNYFLFPPNTHYSYVYKLSGGEKRRLYLMTILMRNPNFLILDEPTNDLDIMTLNVLEDYLKAFQGCVLIVSHDRYFMDKIVDHLFVFQGEGLVKDYPGNYSQYRVWLDNQESAKKKDEKPKPDKKEEVIAKEKIKLTYKEQQEYEALGLEIEELEKEKYETEQKLSQGIVSTDEIVEASKRLSEIETLLPEKENRWLYLSEWI